MDHGLLIFSFGFKIPKYEKKRGESMSLKRLIMLMSLALASPHLLAAEIHCFSYTVETILKNNREMEYFSDVKLHKPYLGSVIVDYEFKKNERIRLEQTGEVNLDAFDIDSIFYDEGSPSFSMDFSKWSFIARSNPLTTDKDSYNYSARLDLVCGKSLQDIPGNKGLLHMIKNKISKWSQLQIDKIK
jgi:hypothetical protein